MNKRRSFARVALIATLLCAVSAGSAAAAGIRATAMGGAYTAVSSDISALLFNPAGIGQHFLDVTVNGASSSPESLNNLQIILTEEPSAADLEKLKDGITLSSGLAGAGLGPFAVVAVVDGSYNVQDLGLFKVVTSQVTKEAVGGLGFRIAKAPLGAGDLRIGFAAHALDSVVSTRTIANGEYTDTQEITGKGFKLSVGALANITPWVTLGVSAHNLAGNMEWEDGSKVALEPVYTAGAAVKVPFLGIVLAADADNQSNVRFGAETTLLFNLISLRVGQATDKDGLTTTTGGFSLNLGPVSAGVAAEGINKSTPDLVMVEASVRF